MCRIIGPLSSRWLERVPKGVSPQSEHAISNANASPYWARTQSPLVGDGANVGNGLADGLAVVGSRVGSVVDDTGMRVVGLRVGPSVSLVHRHLRAC